MIFNVTSGGGAGLSLRVLGGTTQPTNPREGTIWVNTSAAKPDYILSESQPGSPASGLVWIKLGSDGVTVPVDKKGTLAIILAGCAVWSGSTWDNVDAWVYTGGKWVQFSQYKFVLYASGKLADGFSVPNSLIWGPDNTTVNFTVTRNSDNIAATFAITGGIVFTPAIDVTNYKVLEIEIEWSIKGVSWLVLGPSSNNKINGSNDPTMPARYIAESNVSRRAITLDISSVSGVMYIKAVSYAQYGSTLKIYSAVLK